MIKLCDAQCNIILNARVFLKKDMTYPCYVISIHLRSIIIILKYILFIKKKKNMIYIYARACVCIDNENIAEGNRLNQSFLYRISYET
jgi:hypothetical protein